MRRLSKAWIATGIVAVLTFAVCVAGVAVLLWEFRTDAHPQSGTSATSFVEPTPAGPAEPVTYRVDHVADACDVVDFTVFDRFGGLAEHVPRGHRETAGDFPNLQCTARLTNGLLVMRADLAGALFRARDVYDQSRKAVDYPRQGTTTNGAIPGLGTENYFSVTVDDGYSPGASGAEHLLVLDDNLVISLTVSMLAATGQPLTADDLQQICEHLVRRIVTRLRK
ncbi:hypothetical protein ACWEKT_28220 [Nocardia takedensis]